MALTPEQIETIITLWKYSEQQADPRSKEDQITSGLREKSLLSCQYWIKGVGSVCSYWNGSKCSYPRTAKNFPSGYNHGYCDYLGRRNTCDKYDGTVDNENYQCIAPNIFLSGLGKVAGKTDTGYLYAPIVKVNVMVRVWVLDVMVFLVLALLFVIIIDLGKWDLVLWNRDK